MKNKLKTILALVIASGMSCAYAVLPAPDGGYPNGNTAEGTDALFSLIGWLREHGGW